MSKEINTQVDDPDFLWLEEIESERAVAWVRERNVEALSVLQEDPRYPALRSAAESIYTATDRIPYVRAVGSRLLNFWQDDSQVKGILRATTLDEYRKPEPAWTTLLDIDALATEEGENWVYKGVTCLPPAYDRCLVQLSRGGGDAVVIREFDLASQAFVKDGFVVPEGKSDAGWLNRDELLIATNFGEESLTTSGYPRIVKRWRRGTPLGEASVVLEAAVTDMAVNISTQTRPEGSFVFLTRSPAFYREVVYLLDDKGEVRQLPFPVDVDFRGAFHGKGVALLRSDWVIDEQTTLPGGSLVAINLDASVTADRPVDPEVIYAAPSQVAIDTIALGRDTIMVSAMRDVSGELLELRPGIDGWVSTAVDLPRNGSINIVTVDPEQDLALVNYDSFLVPDTLYLMNQGGQPEPVKSLPARFDASPFVSEQHFATSSDGTQVPYYVVRAKDLPLKGAAPTLVDAYGGFELPRKPAYLSALGIEWMKAGGVWVLANIRGGGEYGPEWHKAGLLEHRQRVFDDYYAVHEALIESGITSPAKLGIRGGSNGGLLVMVATTQRPELYKAVICAVPLIDMLRYHKLSAGASWMAEYGDPDIPAHREFISAYSPYQNVKEGVDYPEVFFWTNMRDDRVHPSHARRMVAKMRSQGHEVHYFENTEGGHGGGADPLALAHTTALELVYLKQQLMD